jgi:hypothetical protein
MALLAATRVDDLALIAGTTIDLRRGGEAALPDALAAVYICCLIRQQLHYTRTTQARPAGSGS